MTKSHLGKHLLFQQVTVEPLRGWDISDGDADSIIA